MERHLRSEPSWEYTISKGCIRNAFCRCKSRGYTPSRIKELFNHSGSEESHPMGGAQVKPATPLADLANRERHASTSCSRPEDPGCWRGQTEHRLLGYPNTVAVDRKTRRPCVR